MIVCSASHRPLPIVGYFFIALVPGYLAYRSQETRMTLRAAALDGPNPRELRTSGGMLALRRVRPDVEAAGTALSWVGDKGTPDRQPRRRWSCTRVHSVYLPLIFRALMSPPVAEEDTGTHAKVRAVFGLLLGARRHV